MTTDQECVKAKLLGNPDFMRKLARIFEKYDWQADPEVSSEAVVILVAKEGGLTVAPKRSEV